MPMNPQVRIPLALRVVAILFLLSGLGSLISMIVGALHKNIMLDFGLINIFVYFGLMRFSQGWRKCALVFTWLGIFLSPVVAIIVLFTAAHSNIPQPNIHITSNFNIFGFSFFNTSPVIVFIAVVIYFMLCLWKLSVLNRPDIRVLFNQEDVMRSYSDEFN
jgi:hypothetical protein